MILVGTAAWSIPRAVARKFPGAGTHLERYSRVLPCAEINSSFYREHAATTYAKWAAATPRGFRFAVKLPQTITHELGLRRARAPLQQFLEQVGGLGKKLGVLLIQLPRSQEFEVRVARAFLELLRDRHEGAVVCEPRHASWFEPRADALLYKFRIGRVAADPTSIPAAHQPGGWPFETPGVVDAKSKRGPDAIAYYRLHGSPRMYWSSYPSQRLRQWSDEMRALPKSMAVWCIFDNTASGAASQNALEVRKATMRKGKSRGLAGR